jgi:cell division protein FtsL
MTRSKVVAMRDRCQWRRKKQKTKNKITIAGSINISFAAAVFVFISGLFYLYSVNDNAVKGHQIRRAEKELEELKNENEQLRIQEAELGSLYRIKEESEKMNMSKPEEVVYINEDSPMALK